MDRPEVWDIRDRALVLVPDIPDDASNNEALAIIARMPMDLQLRYMRACQTVERIQIAIGAGRGNRWELT